MQESPSTGADPARVFVTGGDGFVGTHLRTLLADHGDDVVAPATDITDREAITAAMVDARPEIVYHLAAQADVGSSWDNPLDTLRVNVEGTRNVLDAARAAGARRLLAVTSADVYGAVDESDLPITEDQPVRPVSPYAASKAAADLYCLQATLGHDLDVVRARSFNHLGPGQSDRFVASALARRIVEAERDGTGTVAVGNLSARRDFTDVRDVVRAYRRLVTDGERGEVYNVCSGVDRSVDELARAMIAEATVPLELVVDPELFRPVDQPVMRGDNTKLVRRTGWQARIAMGDTLRDLLDFWRTAVAG